MCIFEFNNDIRDVDRDPSMEAQITKDELFFIVLYCVNKYNEVADNPRFWADVATDRIRRERDIIRKGEDDPISALLDNGSSYFDVSVDKEYCLLWMDWEKICAMHVKTDCPLLDTKGGKGAWNKNVTNALSRRADFTVEQVKVCRDVNCNHRVRPTPKKCKAQGHAFHPTTNKLIWGINIKRVLGDFTGDGLNLSIPYNRSKQQKLVMQGKAVDGNDKDDDMDMDVDVGCAEIAAPPPAQANKRKGKDESESYSSSSSSSSNAKRSKLGPESENMLQLLLVSLQEQGFNPHEVAQEIQDRLHAAAPGAAVRPGDSYVP
jgi:hypothetical protein